MDIVFMGTPDFAVPCLERITERGHNVKAVFTQPDRPRGRGYGLAPPPVKLSALRHGVDIYQPETLKNGEAAGILRGLKPDVIVVVAYGKILPAEILGLPKYGCVNAHASLLPKYRGAAPIQHAILNGESVTGVTTMLMDEGLDTGDILLTAKTPVGENMTSGELYGILSNLGAELLCETLGGVAAGTVKPIKQDASGATYAPMLSRDMSKIDWHMPARRIHDQIRGLSPWPVAQALTDGRILKIHASRVSGETAGVPGQVVESSGSLIVACGDGSVEFLEVQPQGGKKMPARDFLRGHPIKLGTILG